MLDNSKITNTDELEFAVFCIEILPLDWEKCRRSLSGVD